MIRMNKLTRIWPKFTEGIQCKLSIRWQLHEEQFKRIFLDKRFHCRWKEMSLVNIKLYNGVENALYLQGNAFVFRALNFFIGFVFIYILFLLPIFFLSGQAGVPDCRQEERRISPSVHEMSPFKDDWKAPKAEKINYSLRTPNLVMHT